MDTAQLISAAVQICSGELEIGASIGGVEINRRLVARGRIDRRVFAYGKRVEETAPIRSAESQHGSIGLRGVRRGDRDGAFDDKINLTVAAFADIRAAPFAAAAADINIADMDVAVYRGGEDDPTRYIRYI